MAFSHACFISYRHRPGREYMSIVEDLRTALQDQVAMLMNPGVYLDHDRLQGGDFFNRALARAICESVCMVVFYVPPYFDAGYPYCAREFRAMEEIEARRLQALGVRGGQHGLIIPIVCRGWDVFPAEIKARRHCYNFEPYYLQRRKISQHPQGRQKVIEIANYIFQRFREMSPSAAALCAGCDQFDLPREADVLPWLTQLLGGSPAAPAAPFPRP